MANIAPPPFNFRIDTITRFGIVRTGIPEVFA